MSYRDRLSVAPGVSTTYAAMTRAERCLFWLAILNLGVFFVISLAIGGDALNGTARDGHYFLMEHGIYTQVSRPVFVYSTVHTLSLLVTTPLGGGAALLARLRS